MDNHLIRKIGVQTKEFHIHHQQRRFIMNTRITTVETDNYPSLPNRKGRVSLPLFTAVLALAIIFAFSTAFAANLPKNCTDEIVALSKGSGFSMSQFTSDLPPAVVKAKAQAKLPFGKPKDSDKTSIGMTFGCLKNFPESPGEIQSLLKDVSQEMAKGAVASQLGAGQQALQQAQAQYQQQQVQPQYQYPPQQVPTEYQQQEQPQYQYPPQQYQQQPPQYQYPPQYAQPYYPPPQAQPQCPKCECNCNCDSQSRNFTASKEQPDNFTTGKRWGTWALNTIFPIGIGSAIIMEDYLGMGTQLVLNFLGVISIAGLGFENYKSCYGSPYQGFYNGDCRYYDTGTRTTAFLPIGIGLLSASALYNIIRSATYNEPIKSDYSSKGYSGFNLAILPNEHGKAMPYVMYNKIF
jgi:hypothetical protein